MNLFPSEEVKIIQKKCGYIPHVLRYEEIYQQSNLLTYLNWIHFLLINFFRFFGTYLLGFQTNVAFYSEIKTFHGTSAHFSRHFFCLLCSAPEPAHSNCAGAGPIFQSRANVSLKGVIFWNVLDLVSTVACYIIGAAYRKSY